MSEHKSIFKEAARERFKDAQILYQKGKIHIAFYLLGYCIECSTKYFIIKSLGCETIKEAEDKIGKIFYYHIDKVENREPILYRRIKFLKSKMIRKNPRIVRDKNFIPTCKKLSKLIGKFYGKYGWRIQLRYTSQYALENYEYPPGYNFSDVKTNMGNIIKEVGGIV